MLDDPPHLSPQRPGGRGPQVTNADGDGETEETEEAEAAEPQVIYTIISLISF